MAQTSNIVLKCCAAVIFWLMYQQLKKTLKGNSCSFSVFGILKTTQKTWKGKLCA